MKIENKQGIDFIVMRPKAHCYCPLGADWYTNEFEISMTPDKYFPDYCDVEAFLNKMIRGKDLIIEDAVSKVFGYFEETYAPLHLNVTSNVSDVTSHSPVTVTKSTL